MGTKIKYENQDVDTSPSALRSNYYVIQKPGRFCVLTKMEETIPAS